MASVGCDLTKLLMQVMGNGGCCTARNVLAYKLRAADSAVIDTYSAISKHHQNIGSRYYPHSAMHHQPTSHGMHLQLA